jgi:uncharacterized protein YkwD
MRKLICMALSTVILALAVAAVGAAPAVAFDRAANETTLLRLINRARTTRHLAPLRIQWALDRAALSHSRDMLWHDYFSHSSANGTSFGTRLVRAGYKRGGYSSWSVSEVIGWGKGWRGTPQAVFKAWMNSKTHRQILLGRRWRDVGVGCARGNFCGMSGCVLYTVDLGRRTR